MNKEQANAFISNGIETIKTLVDQMKSLADEHNLIFNNPLDIYNNDGEPIYYYGKGTQVGMYGPDVYESEGEWASSFC